MADGVLLDWDGLLADTAGMRREALGAALAAEGVALDVASSTDATPGLSIHATVDRALARFGDPTLVELVALRTQRELAARLARGLEIDTAARLFIERAQLRGPVIVASAAGRAETEAALGLAGLLHTFLAVITADDVDRAPSRELYERALAPLERRGAVRREHVIVLGVTPAALRAARDAGLRTVAVGVEPHVAIEADAAIGSLEDASIESLDALLGIAAGRPA
jgi:beta-phosphoglucomutase-like phosphatase (HAD superfamily)